MAVTTWVIWLCACQTMGWCLSVPLAFIVQNKIFVVQKYIQLKGCMVKLQSTGRSSLVLELLVWI